MYFQICPVLAACRVELNVLYSEVLVVGCADIRRCSEHARKNTRAYPGYCVDILIEFVAQTWTIGVSLGRGERRYVGIDQWRVIGANMPMRTEGE